jgi:hypothetical protein
MLQSYNKTEKEIYGRISIEQQIIELPMPSHLRGTVLVRCNSILYYGTEKVCMDGHCRIPKSLSLQAKPK